MNKLTQEQVSELELDSSEGIFEDLACYLFYERKHNLVSPCSISIYIHLLRILFFKKYNKDLLEGRKPYVIRRYSDDGDIDLIDREFTNTTKLRKMGINSSNVSKVPRLEACFKEIDKILGDYEWSSNIMQLLSLLSDTYTFRERNFSKTYTTNDLIRDAKEWNFRAISTN